MLRRPLFILAFIFSLSGIIAQPNAGSEGPVMNEVTIYLVPSAAKYDWASPNTLYHSYIKNYWKTIFRKDRYLTGHAYIELRSPVLVEEIVTGMRALDKDEQRQLVFKEHYGLSILGTHLTGSMDEPVELGQRLDKAFRKGEVSFIRIYVNDEAFSRMMAFYEGYKLRMDSLETPAKCYGGAFWPRYYEEGSGCSAYVISYLDVAGIMQEEFDRWKVEVNIPMALIGGPYNPGQEVRMKDIRKCKSWSDSGTDGKDYESYWVFDPTLMHEWVMEQVANGNPNADCKLKPVTMGKCQGVELDAREVLAPSDSIFMQRSDPSIFIDHYHSRINAGN